MTILEVNNLKKIYTTRFGSQHVQALKNVSFSVESGEFVAIMGESGSGKTTLLNILAALDKPTTGEVLLNGKNIVKIREKEISAFRRDHLGFVFQDFNLLDTFSLKDNIFLPLVLSRTPYAQMQQRLAPIASRLEITDILEKYPFLRILTAAARRSSWSPTAPGPPAMPAAFCLSRTARSFIRFTGPGSPMRQCIRKFPIH